MGICFSRRRTRVTSAPAPGLVPGLDVSTTQVKAALTPLDEKVAAILSAKAKAGVEFSWNRIILKFPGIAENFKRVDAEFEKYDTNKGGTICINEIKSCMTDLGADITDSDLKKLFEGVDMDRSQDLNKKQFLLFLAIGYVSESFPGTNNVIDTTESSVTLTETFDLVIQAFLTFDTSGDGFISKDEVMNMFKSDGSAKKISANQRASRSVISEARWKEMDWNADDSISFKEFLLAFGSWVGLDDDEDDE